MPIINKKTYTNRKLVSHDKFYDGVQWRRITKQNLIDNPFCYYCSKKELSVLGYATDHQLPKRLFPELETDTSNLKTICKSCDGTKRQLESKCQTREQCYIILKIFLV